jgi:hypothetical protein
MSRSVECEADVGHMVQNAVPDLVISEVEAMLGRIVHGTSAAAN